MPSITNEDFLAACFGSAAPNAHVTGFLEDPGALESLGLKHYWAGNKFGRVNPDVLRGSNSYFTISTFMDDPQDGRARRRKALFEATYVIVVDDVGTKVMDTSKLPIPSWGLETSPGNFQWGYILDMPETDAGRVNALLDGMVKLGLCPDGKDPGMKGVTRYVRLPEGVNTKAKYGSGGFKCRLTFWDPSTRFTIEELAQPWGIALPAPGTVRAAPAVMDVDLASDEIFQALGDLGMLTGNKTADGAGYEVTCPWIDDHTGRADSGTGYWPGGGFKCHHGHCADKGRKALGRWVNDKLVELGKKGLGEWAFTKVVSQPSPVPGSGTGNVNVVDEFFEELIYLGPDDRFLSTRTGETLSRIAVDCVWGARLRAVGALPAVGRGLMEPSRWYLDEDNLARARIADRLTYWPGRDVFFHDGIGSLANRWRAPERYPLPVTDAEVKPWLDLVEHIVGGEGPGALENVLDWFALVVGEPGAKPGWHLVVQGGQGIGKDMMIQPVIEGVGSANVGTVNAVSLHSAFNPWAEKRLVVVNELKQNSRGTATGADQYTTLKELTENANQEITINQKNMKAYRARNVSAFYVTSNDAAAIALDGDDRRFLVVMAKVKPLAVGVYASLAAWLARGGLAKVAEWLWQRREAMSGARRRALDGNAPMTAGKAEMIANNEDPVTGWMREQIELGAWPDLMTAQDIQAALAAGARTGAGFGYVPSAKKWSRILQSLGGARVGGDTGLRLKSGVKARVWAVRAPDRFDGFGEAQIANAVASNAGHGFKELDDSKVVNISDKKDDTPRKQE